MAPSGPILLFDGVCNVCNGAVNVIIEHDPAGQFRFASLQSDVGRSLLREYGLAELGLSTMVLIDAGRAFVDSEGVLRVAQRLGGGFRFFVPLLALPRALRDRLYRLFARNRYRLFGKSDHCLVPTPEIRARFLELRSDV